MNCQLSGCDNVRAYSCRRCGKLFCGRHMTFDSNSVPYRCTSCDRVVTIQTAQKVAQETAEKVAQEKKDAKQTWSIFGIFVLVSGLFLVIGYPLGIMVFIVIEWIGAGLCVGFL